MHEGADTNKTNGVEGKPVEGKGREMMMVRSDNARSQWVCKDMGLATRFKAEGVDPLESFIHRFISVPVRYAHTVGTCGGGGIVMGR